MTTTIRRIVSTPRGSWRWQNAYRVSTYAPRKTKDGRWIWQSVGQTIGKMSMPQIRRSASFHRLPVGSIHNRPLSADELRMFAIA